jgi:hypothetical protein
MSFKRGQIVTSNQSGIVIFVTGKGKESGYPTFSGVVIKEGWDVKETEFVKDSYSRTWSTEAFREYKGWLTLSPEPKIKMKKGDIIVAKEGGLTVCVVNVKNDGAIVDGLVIKEDKYRRYKPGTIECSFTADCFDIMPGAKIGIVTEEAAKQKEKEPEAPHPFKKGDIVRSDMHTVRVTAVNGTLFQEK